MKKLLSLFLVSSFAAAALADSSRGRNDAPSAGITSVTESMFNFSDVTTANANAVRHGLLRKLNGNDSYYLGGNGSWVLLDRAHLYDPTDLPVTEAEGDLIYGTGNGYRILPIAGDGSILKIVTGVPAWGGINEDSLSFTDVTTANASTTKHGLLPKLPTISPGNKFLSGLGTFDALPAISESGLTLSDVTTLNATVSQHGFLPKLSGDADDVLRGDGTYGPVPASTLSGDFTYMRVIRYDHTTDLATIDENLPYGVNITVTGAEVGDLVQIVGNQIEGLVFAGHVVSPNTVEFQVFNYTDAPIDPDEQDFQIWVFDSDTVDAPFGSGIETTITGTASGLTFSGVLAAGNSVHASTTVTGAAVGDIVTISQPVITGIPNISATAAVTGPNTVQIRLLNIGGASASIAQMQGLTFNMVLTRIQ